MNPRINESISSSTANFINTLLPISFGLSKANSVSLSAEPDESTDRAARLAFLPPGLLSAENNDSLTNP